MGHKNFNTKKEIEDQYRQTQQRYAGLEQLLRTRYDESVARNRGLYEQEKAGYEDLINTGGIDPTGIRGDITNLRRLGLTGGLDEEAIRRFRGAGVYDELARTGGYTEADKSNIRSRATSGIPSMYDALRNNLVTQNNAQGGYSPGYTSQISKIARDTGRGITDAARDAEIGIGESVRSGRLAGAAGMSQAENALQTLRTGNMLRGSQAAGSLDLGLEESLRTGRTTGLTGLERLRTTPDTSDADLQNLLRGIGMGDQQILQLLQLRKQFGFNPLQLLGLIKYAKYLWPGGTPDDQGQGQAERDYYDPFFDDSSEELSKGGGSKTPKR